MSGTLNLTQTNTDAQLQQEQHFLFEDRIKHVLESGYILPGLAVGHQLGLFTELTTISGPVDVDTLAKRSSCKPRYEIITILFS